MAGTTLVESSRELSAGLHLLASSPLLHPGFFFSHRLPPVADNEAIQRSSACKRFPSNQSYCESEGITSPCRISTRGEAEANSGLLTPATTSRNALRVAVVAIVDTFGST